MRKKTTKCRVCNNYCSCVDLTGMELSPFELLCDSFCELHWMAETM